MKYAQYYHYYNGLLYQALGSDSICIFGNSAGELTPRGMHNVACKQASMLNRVDGLNKRYAGYIIFSGASIMSARPRDTKLHPTGIEYVAICDRAEAVYNHGSLVGFKIHEEETA